ncbi:MAG: DUF4299 family protein [Firmicutes bacterium]|nr:DUF4299 family protein [Bacillota bacterium]
MSIIVKVRQTRLIKEPVPLKVVLGPDLLYGTYDENWSLVAGKRNPSDFVAYTPYQMARGISVNWSEEETDCISFKVLLPTSPAEIKELFFAAQRVCEYWDGEIEVDGKLMEIETFAEDYTKLLLFNEQTLKEMALSIIDEETTELTLFAIMWPLVMGKNEAEAFAFQPSYFSKWLHEKQSVEAYFSKPAFYRSENGILGRFAMSEEMRAIVPIKPYVPYGFDDPETGELIKCDDFGMLIYSAKQDNTIGELKYDDFLAKIKKQCKKKVKNYDGNHLIIEGLTEEELEALVD